MHQWLQPLLCSKAALVQNLLQVLAPLWKNSHFQPERPSGAEESDAFGVGQDKTSSRLAQTRAGEQWLVLSFSSPRCTPNKVGVSLYQHCQEQLSELLNSVQPQPRAAHSAEFLGLALHFRLFLPPNQGSLLQIEGTPPKGSSCDVPGFPLEPPW